MAKYGTAALFLLASMMMQNAAATDGCAFDLVNSVYCPLHDVSDLLEATKLESKTFSGLVDPPPFGSTLESLEAGKEYLYEGVGNPYNLLKTYPSYIATNSSTLECYDEYYGGVNGAGSYAPNDVVKAALKTDGIAEYNGPAMTQYFDDTVRVGSAFEINEESAKKITQYTTNLIEMFQLMEKAIQTVKMGCFSYRGYNDGGDRCQDAVDLWDNAAAVQDGPNYLGTKRCQNYITCGWTFANKDATGEANIAIANQKVLNLFQIGQNAIRTGDIVGAKGIIKLIQSAQLVSYIQGVGRYAQKISASETPNVEGENKEYAEGMAFSTGMLPQLYQCDRSAAKTVDKTFQLKKGNSFSGTIENFLGVLRKNYQCLGITCEDVGGLWNSKKDDPEPKTPEYYPGAQPCVTEYGTYVAGN